MQKAHERVCRKRMSACAESNARVQKAKAWPSLARLVDDISCVAFTVAMTVFLQFWVLHWVTGGLVERSQDRPPWLGFVMHVINGVLAVSDVLISNPRTFSRRSRVMLFSFAGMYGTLLATCRCGT